MKGFFKRLFLIVSFVPRIILAYFVFILSAVLICFEVLFTGKQQKPSDKLFSVFEVLLHGSNR